MPPHLRRFVAALLVLALCGWVLSEAPTQEDGLQASRDLQEKSRSLVGAGRYAEALPLLRELHEAYPTSHVYLSRLADIHAHLGLWPVGAWGLLGVAWGATRRRVQRPSGG